MFTFILTGNRPYFHLLEANLSHIVKHYPDAAVMFYDWGLKPGQRLRLKDRHPVLEIIDWKDRINCQGNLFDVPELERIRHVAFSYVASLPYPQRKLGKWCLKRFPQSRITRADRGRGVTLSEHTSTQDTVYPGLRGARGGHPARLPRRGRDPDATNR